MEWIVIGGMLLVYIRALGATAVGTAERISGDW
jgi:hypothetical protein